VPATSGAPPRPERWPATCRLARARGSPAPACRPGRCRSKRAWAPGGVVVRKNVVASQVRYMALREKASGKNVVSKQLAAP
jgi:hypothetical protein